MPNDDVRRLILARRARFVALALAGMTAGAEGCTSDATLNPSPLPRPDATSQPTPCLGITCEQANACGDPDAGEDAGATDASDDRDDGRASG